MSAIGEARIVISGVDNTGQAFAAVERHAKDLGSTLKAVGASAAQIGRATAALDGYGKVAREVDAVAAAMARAAKEAPGLKGPAAALGASATAATARMRELEVEARRVAQATGKIELFRGSQGGLAKARGEFAGAKAAVLDFARGIEVADAKVLKLKADLATVKAAGDRARASAEGLKPNRADASDREAFAAKSLAYNTAMRPYQEGVVEQARISAAIVEAEAARKTLGRGYDKAQSSVSGAAAALDREKAAAIGLKREIESVVGPMTTLASAEARLKAQADGVASAMEHQAVASKRAAADARRTMELTDRSAGHHAAPAGAARGGGHGGHGDSTILGLAGLYATHAFGHQAEETVETYREFDKERRYGKVVMGLSDEQQKPLVDQAVHGGATTRFNDIQWLESQRELAARGYNKDQVMAFSPVAAQIGQALDVSMPEAVKALEGAMLGFGKDTSTFEKAMSSATRTADLQVKASKISGMNFEDVVQLYKYAAAPAKMAHLSEESMLAYGAISKKSNMGGDESGVAFRALAKNLLTPTSGAQIAMQAAGIDFSKFQRAPDHLDTGGFADVVAKEFGIRLTTEARGSLDKIFTNKDLIGNAAKFMPAVQDVLAETLGKDAKSRNKVAQKAHAYRDASMQEIDTNGLMASIMEGIHKSPQLANAIFGSKQGGRIFAALGDPEFYSHILGELKNESGGFAKKVSDERMTGFNAELQKAQGSLLNLRTAIGRAWDDDGKGGGGLATAAAARLAEFTQAVAEAPPGVLQLGTAAAAAGTAFVGLKSIGLLKGGFGLNASALALDRAAGHLMMVGGGPGGIAGRLPGGGVVAAGGAVAEGIAIPAVAEAAAAAIAIIGAAAVVKLVKASAEAQEAGHGGQWAAPTPATEDLDRQRLQDQEDRGRELRRQIAINKSAEKLPGSSDTVNFPLQQELDQVDGQARLLRDRLGKLFVSPDREAEHGKAFMAMRRPEEFGPGLPEGWRDPVYHKPEFAGPNLPPLPDTDRAERARRSDFSTFDAARAWLSRSWRGQRGADSSAPSLNHEMFVPPMPPLAPTLGRPPALQSEGGPVPVRVMSTAVDPRSLPGGTTPAGVTRDFSLGNRTGSFSSPGLGTDGTFSPFPGHHAPAFTPVEAHAAPIGDLVGALSGLKATVDGPITAQVTGNAEVSVTVKVEAGSSLISAAATASQAKASMPLSSGGGSTGGTGVQRTAAAPMGQGGIGHR